MMRKTVFSVLLTLCVFITYTLMAHADEPLLPGIPEDTSLSPATYKNHYIDVPECAYELTVEITNGSGDLDLFMRYGSLFTADSYQGMIAESDYYSDTFQWADEIIDVTAELGRPIQEGRWYVAPVNWNDWTTSFTLTAELETGMLLPDDQIAYNVYDPVELPFVSTFPEEAKPIGVGPVASGGGTFACRVGLCEFTGPVDLYFAIWASFVPNELFVVTTDGSIVAVSQSGLLPWKTGVTEPVYEDPFGVDIPLAALPPGKYFLYIAATSPNSLDQFYVWSTFFIVPGVAGPNSEPYIDLVVDDTVIDFGRLDEWRRNTGVGVFLTPTPLYPSLVPGVGVQNLCTYLNAFTYLKTLPLLPITDPNHFNPEQYPDGMTCVYAIAADVDSDPLTGGFVLPEPLFGRGNLYTAIDIPGGVPAGTLIDTYETLNAYNAVLTSYANNGWLTVQPHIRTNAPGTQVAPIEPLRTPPQEFPYVIAFTNGTHPSGLGITAGQTVTEAANPLGLTPQGKVFKVILKDGSWTNGNARGYLWLIPVTDDFWDLRHNPAGDPALFVNGVRMATISNVGQALPVIWEAPDDPNAEGTTHDRRHVDPGTIPRGGTVQLEARANDGVNPEVNAFDWVAFPDGFADIEIEKTVYRDHDGGASCPGSDALEDDSGNPITYCFEIRNTGSTYLNQIRITDPYLGITEADLTLVSGTIPLAPGDTVVYYYETQLTSDLTNVATVEGNPCDESENDLLGLADVRDQDSARVSVSVSSEDYPYLTVTLKLQWDDSRFSLILVAVKDSLSNLDELGVGEPTVYSGYDLPPYSTARVIPKETGTYIVAAYANGFPTSMMPECQDGQPVQPVPTVNVAFTLTVEETPYNYFPERETDKYEFGETSTRTFDGSVKVDPNDWCLDEPILSFGEVQSITTVTVNRP